MSDFPSQQQDKFVLRLPDGLRDRIKNVAANNNRSMNAEVVDTLEKKYPAPIMPDDLLISTIQKALTDGGLTETDAELKTALVYQSIMRLAIDDNLSDSSHGIKARDEAIGKQIRLDGK